MLHTLKDQSASWLFNMVLDTLSWKKICSIVFEVEISSQNLLIIDNSLIKLVKLVCTKIILKK